MTSPTSPVAGGPSPRGLLWLVLGLLGAFLLVRQVVLPALGCPT